jgi:cytochrome b
MTTPPDRPVRVWDLPTRIFHWVLAATLVGSVVSAKMGGNAPEWHFRVGYLVFTLLAFGLVWDIASGRWSRFRSFIYAPSTVPRYLRGTSRGDEHLDVGHSPLGSFSVFTLLLFLCAQVAIVALVVMHIGASVFYLLARKNNLIRPRLVGDKNLPAATPASANVWPQRLLALALVAACAALVTWVVGWGA